MWRTRHEQILLGRLWRRNGTQVGKQCAPKSTPSRSCFLNGCGVSAPITQNRTLAQTQSSSADKQDLDSTCLLTPPLHLEVNAPPVLSAPALVARLRQPTPRLAARASLAEPRGALDLDPLLWSQGFRGLRV